MRKLIIVVLIGLLVLTGCSFPFAYAKANQTPLPITDLSGSGTPTPTPFQPLDSSSEGGSIGQNEGNLSTPTAIPPTPTPYADLGFELPQSMVNILLLGSDHRADRSFRTDVIMMLSLDPVKGTAVLISFPRDLYVSIPGIGMERINTSQEFGGFPLTQKMFKLNFGVEPDYYMLTDFSGFSGIVDTLGGIDVYAQYNMTDVCDLPIGVDSSCTINAGWNHFDGQTALWYVRARKATSDFDRTRRAQEVITAIFKKMMSLNAINRVPELYNMFKASVETNVPLTTIANLMPLAVKIANDPNMVKRFAIGPDQVTSYVVPVSGAQVLLPNQDAVMTLMREAMSP